MLTSDQPLINTKVELLNSKDVKTEIITYRFSINEDNMSAALPDKSTRFRQIIPSVCASLTCLPFGLMLGWPSPTYPFLVNEESPIPITMDQSAMVAGFLMIGNAVGTPFCRRSCLGTKFGILIGIILMSAGWALMWQSQNIYWLLGSRLLVGLGNGYASGQVKIYIANTCDEDLKIFLTKMLNLYVFLGIILIYSFGPFINFRTTSITCLLISIVLFFLLLLLPTTPKELLKSDKINQARKLISKLKPNANANNEIFRITESIKNKTIEKGLLDLIRDKNARLKFLCFVILVFCQQFSGAPSTMIYTQILFRESHCPYPQYLAIAYAIIFFICNVFGIFFMPRFNKRKVLLLSSGGVIILIVAKALVIYYEVNDKYWSYTSVVVLFLFIIVHTLGLGNIPVTMISDYFSTSYRTCVTHFFIAFHSILALVITKIFQVLMTQYNVGVPFYLFFCVSCFAFVFIYFFIKIKTEQISNVFANGVPDMKNNKVVI